MPLHSKQLGNIGELKVAANLTSQGYYVFSELGDICKSDLIALGPDYNPIKIQVKARTPIRGAVSLKSDKSGPEYRFTYEPKHADVYAIYVLGYDTILYVSSRELLAKSTLTIRLEPTKNNQTAKINLAEDYLIFEHALNCFSR